MTLVPSSTPTPAPRTATARTSRRRSSASTMSRVVIGTGPDDLMMAAAEACPSTAIRIIDRETREQVYP